MRPRCAAALSEHPEPRVAIAEVLGELLGRIGPHPDAAILLVSGRMAKSAAQLAATTQALLAPELLVGASVPGVFSSSDVRIAADAVVVLALNINGAPPRPHRLRPGANEIPPGDGPVLVFAEGAVGGRAVVGPPVSTAGGMVILDHQQYSDGGVGLAFDRQCASAIEYWLPVLEGAEMGQDDPARSADFFTVAGGGGLLLFAEEAVAGLIASRFDFEVALEGFVGSMVGVIGPTVPLSTRKRPGEGSGPGRRVTGLILH